MTIRRGQPWGEAVSLPSGVPVATTDAAAAAVVAAGGPEVVLAAGDMARTLGGGTSGRAEGTAVRATVDCFTITDERGERRVVLAHVVARRRWWRGAVVLVMNAEYLRAFDVVPRGHPNDGRVDVVEVSPAMGVRERLMALRRARTGTHLPHPQITVASVPAWEGSFSRPLWLWVDGRRWCRSQTLAVTVDADRVVVYA